MARKFRLRWIYIIKNIRWTLKLIAREHFDSSPWYRVEILESSAFLIFFAHTKYYGVLIQIYNGVDHILKLKVFERDLSSVGYSWKFTYKTRDSVRKNSSQFIKHFGPSTGSSRRYTEMFYNWNCEHIFRRESIVL